MSVTINCIFFKVCQDFFCFALCHCAITHRGTWWQASSVFFLLRANGNRGRIKGILSSSLYQANFTSLWKGLEPGTKTVRTLSPALCLCVSLGLILGLRPSGYPRISFNHVFHSESLGKCTYWLSLGQIRDWLPVCVMRPDLSLSCPAHCTGHRWAT